MTYELFSKGFLLTIHEKPFPYPYFSKNYLESKIVWVSYSTILDWMLDIFVGVIS